MKPGRKTYWHLGADRRLPSDYEIATSRLLTHVARGGFAVALPASGFYARHQAGSLLVSDRLEDFVDPRATTYTRYVDLGREREAYTGRLLGAIEESEHDRQLAPEWLETLGRALSPLRFACHGLQMSAAYVGQMAPSGRVAVAALFQCGDEIRRIQRLAYRVALLARRDPEVATTGRALWQSDPAWQHFRRAIERLLVTYDWGEALVALNLCLKPAIDELFFGQLADAAERARDHLDAQILRSLREDAAWHRAWTDAVLELAFADRPTNRAVVAHWVETWRPAVEAMRGAAGALLGSEPRRPVAEPAPEPSRETTPRPQLARPRQGGALG
jgi:toluene monooxygenase system protein E